MKKKSTVEQYKGLSFSDASLKIQKKFPNASLDPIEKASMEFELEDLIKHQEKVKTIDTMTKALKEYKKGGRLSKYWNGGPINGVPQAEDPWNGVNPNLPFIENPFQGMMDTVVQPAYTNTNSPTLPQLQSKVVAGQMPVLGQHGVNPVPNTPATIPQVNPMSFKVNVNESNVSTQPRSTGEMSAHTPALLGQGLSTLINAGILAGGYNKVAPVENPYESQVINNMASRGIDTTQQTNSILSAYNAARQNLSGARSINVKNALDSNLMNITSDNLAESNLNQQGMNNQYKADLSNTLNSLGTQKMNARTLSEELTARNKGQFQSNFSALGSNIADSGEFFTNKMTNDNYNKIMGDILSNKYQNVGLNPEVLQRMKEGKSTPEDISILKTIYGDKAVSEMFPDFKFESK